MYVLHKNYKPRGSHYEDVNKIIASDHIEILYNKQCKELPFCRDVGLYFKYARSTWDAELHIRLLRKRRYVYSYTPVLVDDYLVFIADNMMDFIKLPPMKEDIYKILTCFFILSNIVVNDIRNLMCLSLCNLIMKDPTSYLKHQSSNDLIIVNGEKIEQYFIDDEKIES